MDIKCRLGHGVLEHLISKELPPRSNRVEVDPIRNALRATGHHGYGNPVAPTGQVGRDRETLANDTILRSSRPTVAGQLI